MHGFDAGNGFIAETFHDLMDGVQDFLLVLRS